MPIDTVKRLEQFSTGTIMRIYGEAIRDEQEILEIRRVRLTDLLEEGGISAKLEAQLRDVLAEVEGRLASRGAPALHRAA